jgi:hypothetical protein
MPRWSSALHVSRLLYFLSLSRDTCSAHLTLLHLICWIMLIEECFVPLHAHSPSPFFNCCLGVTYKWDCDFFQYIVQIKIISKPVTIPTSFRSPDTVYHTKKRVQYNIRHSYELWHTEEASALSANNTKSFVALRRHVQKRWWITV